MREYLLHHSAILISQLIQISYHLKWPLQPITCTTQSSLSLSMDLHLHRISSSGNTNRIQRHHQRDLLFLGKAVVDILSIQHTSLIQWSMAMWLRLSWHGGETLHGGRTTFMTQKRPLHFGEENINSLGTGYTTLRLQYILKVIQKSSVRPVKHSWSIQMQKGVGQKQWVLIMRASSVEVSQAPRSPAAQCHQWEI